MKKVFKACMVAIVMVATTIGAYARSASHKPNVNDTVYTWIRTGGEQGPNEEDPFVGTKSQAEDNFGCRGTIDECAVGTPQTPGPQLVIYQH